MKYSNVHSEKNYEFVVHLLTQIHCVHDAMTFRSSQQKRLLSTVNLLRANVWLGLRFYKWIPPLMNCREPVQGDFAILQFLPQTNSYKAHGINVKIKLVYSHLILIVLFIIIFPIFCTVLGYRDNPQMNSVDFTVKTLPVLALALTILGKRFYE